MSKMPGFHYRLKKDFSRVLSSLISRTFVHRYHITLLSGMICQLEFLSTLRNLCVCSYVTYCMFSIGLDIDELYFALLCEKWLLIDGEG